MATVKAAVKESLLGTSVETQLSQQARATFVKHARKGDDGELYMSEDDFINAIAPEKEDYVS
jgi:solute carrier family 25 aspartate/glutamate transporter 12/13